MINPPVKIISYLFVGLGVGLFLLSLLVEDSVNVALPLVFLMLGGLFFILVSVYQQKWNWAPALYIPGSLLLALGLIFLLNVLTNDWNAWAYAWLLMTAGAGLGLLLANRQMNWHSTVNPIGWGISVVSITLFAVFGAIAGGMFINIMAPILIILGGLSLRWLPVGIFLPEHLLARFQHTPSPALEANASKAKEELVEPLSTRELEVLQLVDMGLSNQQIAARLNIAASTVKTHINNIYGKLGVQTRVQAINRARELGLLDTKAAV